MLQHPLFWLFCSGFSVGAIIALLSVRTALRADPQKFRKSRPVKIYLLLTSAVTCLTIAFFASAPGGIPLRFLTAPLTGVLAGGLGLRFKKAAGIPLLIICAASVAVGAAALPAWNAVNSRETVGNLIVLSLDEADTSLCVSANVEQVLRVPAGRIRVKTDFLSFPKPYLIFSALSFYRLVSLLAADSEYPLAAAPSAWEKALLGLPGVRIETVETELQNPQLFSSYTISVYPDGEVRAGEKPGY
jgi:hypothetical protein